jgi:hypothetical protein
MGFATRSSRAAATSPPTRSGHSYRSQAFHCTPFERSSPSGSHPQPCRATTAVKLWPIGPGCMAAGRPASRRPAGNSAGARAASATNSARLLGLRPSRSRRPTQTWHGTRRLRAGGPSLSLTSSSTRACSSSGSKNDGKALSGISAPPPPPAPAAKPAGQLGHSRPVEQTPGRGRRGVARPARPPALRQAGRPPRKRTVCAQRARPPTSRPAEDSSEESRPSPKRETLFGVARLRRESPGSEHSYMYL